MKRIVLSLFWALTVLGGLHLLFLGGEALIRPSQPLGFAIIQVAVLRILFGVGCIISAIMGCIYYGRFLTLELDVELDYAVMTDLTTPISEKKER